MSETEKAIENLNTAKLILCNPQMLTPEMCIRIGQAITDAIALLKEQQGLMFGMITKSNAKCTDLGIHFRRLVLCKDCKYAEILPWLDNAIICKKHNYTGVRPNEFYCADGERR